MGHIFHALRPGMRNRKDSLASTHSVDSSLSPTVSDTESDTGQYIAPSPRHVVNNPRPSRLSHSQSNDSMSTHARLPLPPPRPQPAVAPDGSPRPKPSSSVSVPPPLPLRPQLPYAVYKPRNAMGPAPPPDLSPIDAPPVLPLKDPTSPTSHRWFSNLLPFLSRDDAPQTISPMELPPTPAPSPPPIPQRGEVVCLEYRTLDDKGMRRLEGRSDHRPVIGSYAVYI